MNALKPNHQPNRMRMQERENSKGTKDCHEASFTMKGWLFRLCATKEKYTSFDAFVPDENRRYLCWFKHLNKIFDGIQTQAQFQMHKQNEHCSFKWFDCLITLLMNKNKAFHWRKIAFFWPPQNYDDDIENRSINFTFQTERIMLKSVRIHNSKAQTCECGSSDRVCAMKTKMQK